ncbi:MAG: nitrate reductase [Desulfovibrionaceae bacterium]|nr:nitrate reductase [Desulfovibrionaceae bacterium]
MAIIPYIVAYAGIVAFWVIIAFRCIAYLKKPMHLRWELYPVAHAKAGRAAYGGSYLEDSGWWRKKQNPSLPGGIKGFAVEFFLLHSTLYNNRALWFRTYPFHFGLYMLAGVLCLALLASVLTLPGVQGGVILPVLARLGSIASLAAFLGIATGSLGLIHYRLAVPDLKMYSTPEHFLNLGLFLGLSVLGLALCLTLPSFFDSLCSFMAALLSFSFVPQDNALFSLFIISLFALIAYIPATHMGHFFMKYFLWHDIRWGDQPTQDNPETQRKIDAALTRPVSWKGGHIAGGGGKSWAETALSKPTAPKKYDS